VEKKERIEREIIEIFQSETGEPGEAERTFAELGLDSLDTLSLFRRVEEKYGVKVVDGNRNVPRSIAQLAHYISERAI
jgi:acyl carrier protein